MQRGSTIYKLKQVFCYNSPTQDMKDTQTDTFSIKCFGDKTQIPETNSDM